MELILVIIVVVVVVNLISKVELKKQESRHEKITPYVYTRRDSIATPAEQEFFHRLAEVTQGKYLVLPQIHLSSLAVNKTVGKYHKAGFQRINRRSVDYILADRQTLAPVYAVELDDSSHNTVKARAVDSLKEEILNQIGIPLVRFRNVHHLTNEQIVEKFKETANHD